jgi:hypothetical protein
VQQAKAAPDQLASNLMAAGLVLDRGFIMDMQRHHQAQMFEKQQQWYYEKNSQLRPGDADKLLKEKEPRNIHEIFNSLSQDEQSAM